MAYPEFMIEGMRQELTRLGIEETRTSDSVRQAIQGTAGTLLVVVNSVCGCAAGKARPGVAIAMRHAHRPDRAITVFAGADVEATEEARRNFAPYPPSSPQIALFKQGKLVHMIERRQIEGRAADEIAQDLMQAFDQHCTTAAATA